MAMEILLIFVGALLTLLSTLILTRMSRNEEKSDKREAEREERDALYMEALDANFCITKELFECVLHGKEPNGDLEEAYQYKQNVKHKLEDYMRRRASR